MSIRQVLNIDLQLFGNVNYYSALNDYRYIKFDLYLPFRKSTFLNRCTLPGPNGLIDLSIPLVGGRDQKGPLEGLRIANRYPWQDQHLRTLSACYGRSPWFEHYIPGLKDIYNQKEEYLIPFLERCNNWIFKQLKTDDVIIEYVRAEVSKHIPETEKRSGEKVCRDWNENEEGNNTVDLRYQFLPKHPRLDGQPVLKYPQVFEERNGFIPDLSILDLLFCEGPGARKILMGK